MTWTDLPGPSAFVALVEQDLRESKSVWATVPRCFDDDWLHCVRCRLESLYAWQETPNTLEEFYREISCRDDGQPFVCIRDIIDHRIRGRGFILRNPPQESWARWISFLRDFAELNRSLPEIERNVLIIVSEVAIANIPNEPLLMQRGLEGFIKSEDTFFHAARSVESGEGGELWRKIRLHVSSELALWDFRLCEGLCELSIRDLLEPIEWLKEYGARQGWTRVANESDPMELKQQGLLFRLEGGEAAHSALLALQGQSQELVKRIWAAQIRVLFPLIEDQRLRLLKRIRQIQPGTILSWERELEEDGELEIGILHHRMVTSKAFGSQLGQFASKLKRIRNNLAHLQICKPEDLPGDKEWLK